MIKKLPEQRETRIKRFFAFFPTQGLDINDNKVSIWLCYYYQKQRAAYYGGYFEAWENDYWPTIDRRED